MICSKTEMRNYFNACYTGFTKKKQQKDKILQKDFSLLTFQFKQKKNKNGEYN